MNSCTLIFADCVFSQSPPDFIFCIVDYQRASCKQLSCQKRAARNCSSKTISRRARKISVSECSGRRGRDRDGPSSELNNCAEESRREFISRTANKTESRRRILHRAEIRRESFFPARRARIFWR